MKPANTHFRSVANTTSLHNMLGEEHQLPVDWLVSRGVGLVKEEHPPLESKANWLLLDSWSQVAASPLGLELVISRLDIPEYLCVQHFIHCTPVNQYYHCIEICY